MNLNKQENISFGDKQWNEMQQWNKNQQFDNNNRNLINTASNKEILNENYNNYSNGLKDKVSKMLRQMFVGVPGVLVAAAQLLAVFL